MLSYIISSPVKGMWTHGDKMTGCSSAAVQREEVNTWKDDLCILHEINKCLPGGFAPSGGHSWDIQLLCSSDWLLHKVLPSQWYSVDMVYRLNCEIFLLIN